MTTDKFSGLPSPEEIESWAGQYFQEFDERLCADGIEKLVTTGDTSVISNAYAKAQNVGGRYLNESDYLNILSSLSAKEQTAGYSPVVISQSDAQTDGYKQRKLNSETKSSGIVVGSKTLDDIRGDFPILSEKVNGYDLVWFDNGATTQRPKAVIDRLTYYYEHENSNVHRGAHELAARSTDAYENARQTVANFIGAPSKDNIVFVRGTTEGINLVAQSYVKQYLQPGDEIILTLLEHHANIVPWQLIAQETGAVIKVAPVDETGQIILSEYARLFTK